MGINLSYNLVSEQRAHYGQLGVYVCQCVTPAVTERGAIQRSLFLTHSHHTGTQLPT